MTKKDKFTDWLKHLKVSLKLEKEIGNLVAQIAEFSGIETFKEIVSTLTEEDIKKLKKLNNRKSAEKELRRLFKLRSGKTIKDLIDDLQLLYFENAVYKELKNKKNMNLPSS
jgi:GTP1/Obg family GTP-binding protein